MIFRFPLREARRDGFFSTTDFTAVLDFDEDDEPLARAALARLRRDQDAGYQHVLLARAKNKTRAAELFALYERLAPEFTPRLLHDGVPAKERQGTLADLRAGVSRVVICVDMLGEGFDLPTLKVGAFHDTRQSLTTMIRLIGRLDRTSSPVPIGPASIFIRQDPKHNTSPLRDLLREDADWGAVLADVTERANQRAQDVNDLRNSFSAPRPT